MPAETQSRFEWDDARVLLALWRARTLSGAGAALGVNASTVGRRLDALESALGARLFDRTPDGVLPTAAAERLVPHAERLEQAAVDLAGAAEGFETEPEGLVRLTAPPGVADHFVAPALPRLLAKYPRLRVELDASIAYADLSRREADLALRAARPTTGDLVAQRLVEEDEIALASPALVRSAGALARLDQVPWITWGANLGHILGARWVGEQVPAAAVVLRTSSIGAQVSAAQAGLGAVLLPRPYLAVSGLVPLVFTPALARKLPPWPRGQLWIVGHRALREVPRIAAVWSFIVDELDPSRLPGPVPASAPAAATTAARGATARVTRSAPPVPRAKRAP